MSDKARKFLVYLSPWSISSDKDKFRKRKPHRHAMMKKGLKNSKTIEPTESKNMRNLLLHWKARRASQSLSNANRDSLGSSLSKLKKNHKLSETKATNPELCFLWTVDMHYHQEIDFWPYWYVNQSLKYDDIVSSYRTTEKVKFQMKAHFFKTINVISIIRFLATFRFADNTRNIFEGAATWVLSLYEMKTLTNALNGRICAEEHISLFATFVCNEAQSSRTMLRSYTKVVKYLVKKYGTDQAIAKNAAVPHYVHLPNMSPQRYANDLIS